MLKLSPKILFVFVSLMMLSNQSIVNAATLQCKYFTSFIGDWWGLDESMYYCIVKDNGIFTDERVILDSVDGEHEGEKTNDDVQGIRMVAFESMKYFPQNLENIFGNLIFISIYLADLQEIKQSDIKAFTKLKNFQIYSTKITTIDEDLFKFNPELTAILLQDNQISHIDPNVFDHLDNLVYLWLQGNQCKNALSQVENSRSKVLKLVERVRNAECVNSDIMLKKNKVIKAENEECATEKSKLSIQAHELQNKVKTYEEQIAKLNKNLNELRKKLNNDLTKIQTANQELMTKSENLSLLHGKCESKLALSDTITEKFLESNDKMNEWKDKYINSLQTNKAELIDCSNKNINLLQSSKTENQNLNEKLHECNDKYITLLHAKLIESEKVNKELNEEIRNNNKV